MKTMTAIVIFTTSGQEAAKTSHKHIVAIKKI